VQRSWLGLIWVDAKEILDLFFAVAPVAAGVDADCGEFASFTPAFDGERGDTEEIGDFADC